MDSYKTKRAIRIWREKYSKDAWKQSFKGSFIVCLFTLVNGFILGPMGLAFGGISGGVLAYEMTKKRFKSIAHSMYDEYKPYCYPGYP